MAKSLRQKKKRTHKNVCIATYIKQYPKRGNCQKIMIYVRFLSFFLFFFPLLRIQCVPESEKESEWRKPKGREKKEHKKEYKRISQDTFKRLTTENLFGKEETTEEINIKYKIYFRVLQQLMLKLNRLALECFIQVDSKKTLSS